MDQSYLGKKKNNIMLFVHNPQEHQGLESYF